MRKNDYLLILFIILFSALLFFIRQTPASKNNILTIKIGKEIVQTIPLSGENSQLSLKTKHGTVQIKIKENKVKVLSSPCKDKLCVKQGYISKPGETIACLPEKVILTIKNDHSNDLLINPKEEEIDAVLK